MSSNPKIHKWLYSDTLSGKFSMIPPELFEEPAFQKLSHAARTFYLLLNVHRETDWQRACLYNTLTEYNELLDLGMTKEEIQNESHPTKRTKYNSGYFVIPQSHYEKYGYKKSYVTKLKKELIAEGFIRIKWGGKGKYNAWNENVTIYQFTNTWKGKNEESSPP